MALQGFCSRIHVVDLEGAEMVVVSALTSCVEGDLYCRFWVTGDLGAKTDVITVGPVSLRPEELLVEIGGGFDVGAVDDTSLVGPATVNRRQFTASP